MEEEDLNSEKWTVVKQSKTRVRRTKDSVRTSIVNADSPFAVFGDDDLMKITAFPEQSTHKTANKRSIKSTKADSAKVAQFPEPEMEFVSPASEHMHNSFKRKKRRKRVTLDTSKVEHTKPLPKKPFSFDPNVFLLELNSLFKLYPGNVEAQIFRAADLFQRAFTGCCPEFKSLDFGSEEGLVLSASLPLAAVPHDLESLCKPWFKELKINFSVNSYILGPREKSIFSGVEAMVASLIDNRAPFSDLFGVLVFLNVLIVFSPAVLFPLSKVIASHGLGASLVARQLLLWCCLQPAYSDCSVLLDRLGSVIAPVCASEIANMSEFPNEIVIFARHCLCKYKERFESFSKRKNAMLSANEIISPVGFAGMNRFLNSVIVARDSSEDEFCSILRELRNLVVRSPLDSPYNSSLFFAFLEAPLLTLLDSEDFLCLLQRDVTSCVQVWEQMFLSVPMMNNVIAFKILKNAPTSVTRPNALCLKNFLYSRVDVLNVLRSPDWRTIFSSQGQKKRFVAAKSNDHVEDAMEAVEACQVSVSSSASRSLQAFVFYVLAFLFILGVISFWFKIQSEI